MKMNIHVKSFGAGVLACAALMTVYSFTASAPVYDQDGGVTVQQAKGYHDIYMQADPPSVDGVIQAIEVSSSMISAMGDVSARNEGTNGIRVYFGQDADGNTANVIVATENGTDVTSGFMRVVSGSATACPTTCDANSPIVK